jgi:hypothetical protein
MNALVPSDLIENGKLTLNSENKPCLKGKVFDAIVYLYPQFAKEKTLRFLEQYSSNNGKLMLEGVTKNDFNGNNISARFEKIKSNATFRMFEIPKIPEFGIMKNVIQGGCYNMDGSVVLTDYESLKTNVPTTFIVELDGKTYSGNYVGMLAFKSEEGKLTKITSSGLLELKRNGKTVLKFDALTTFYYELNGDEKILTIADKQNRVKLIVCKL